MIKLIYRIKAWKYKNSQEGCDGLDHQESKDLILLRLVLLVYDIIFSSLEIVIFQLPFLLQNLSLFFFWNKVTAKFYQRKIKLVNQMIKLKIICMCHPTIISPFQEQKLNGRLITSDIKYCDATIKYLAKYLMSSQFD